MDCENAREAIATGYLNWEDAHFLDVYRHLDACPDCATARVTAQRVVACLQEGDPAGQLPAMPELARYVTSRPRRPLAASLLNLAAVLLIGVTCFLAGRTLARWDSSEAPARSEPERTATPVDNGPEARPVSTGRALPPLPGPVLAGENLRALRIREFALNSQVALALQLAGRDNADGPLASGPDVARLLNEGYLLVRECEARGNHQLAGMLLRPMLVLEGRQADPTGDYTARLIDELGQIQLGVMRPNQKKKSHQVTPVKDVF